VTPEIPSLIHGDSADLLWAAGKLHLKPGDRVADTTYGLRKWWRKVDWVTVVGSDKYRGPGRRLDFAATGYPDISFDDAVFDPWFVEYDRRIEAEIRAGTRKNASYGRDLVKQTTDMVRRDYEQGIRELVRIVKPGGKILVKCQDHRAAGRLIRWSHVVYNLATYWHGCRDVDLFVLDSAWKGPLRPAVGSDKVQRHARSAHSYLWVFERPKHPRHL
jgi:hypothetical protein